MQFAVTNSCIALSLEVCPDRRQTETGNEGKFTSFPSTDTGLFNTIHMTSDHVSGMFETSSKRLRKSQKH